MNQFAYRHAHSVHCTQTPALAYTTMFICIYVVRTHTQDILFHLPYAAFVRSKVYSLLLLSIISLLADYTMMRCCYVPHTYAHTVSILLAQLHRTAFGRHIANTSFGMDPDSVQHPTYVCAGARVRLCMRMRPYESTYAKLVDCMRLCVIAIVYSLTFFSSLFVFILFFA